MFVYTLNVLLSEIVHRKVLKRYNQYITKNLHPNERRFMRCVRDFNLRNQEISQSCNMLIIIKLLQINYITKYH